MKMTSDRGFAFMEHNNFKNTYFRLNEVNRNNGPHTTYLPSVPFRRMKFHTKMGENKNSPANFKISIPWKGWSDLRRRRHPVKHKYSVKNFGEEKLEKFESHEELNVVISFCFLYCFHKRFNNFPPICGSSPCPRNGRSAFFKNCVVCADHKKDYKITVLHEILRNRRKS